jgi:glucose/arabinose dehydrogenase
MPLPSLRSALLACAAALLLAPAAASAAGPFDSAAADQLTTAAAASTSLPAGFTESVAWSNITAPTTLRFAPDGRVFVALKSGIIDVFDSVDDTTPTVYADLREEVADFWDRGLLGLALDPQFDTGRPYVYALYTYNKDPNSSQYPRWPDDACPEPNPGANGDGCVVTARLSRIGPDGTEKVLIEDWCQQYPTHSIGTVQFGPDGALYVGSGDGASYTFADYGQDGNPVNPCGDPPGAPGTHLTRRPPKAARCAARGSAARPASRCRSTARSCA